MDAYFFLHSLGEGCYGDVYKAINVSSKQAVVIRHIHMNMEELDLPPVTVREIAVLKELIHPNVIRLNEIIFDNVSSSFSLVFEYLPTNLQAYIKRKQMTPMVVKSFLYQIMQAIIYCQTKSVLHHDLRPRNILVDPEEGKIKITGFGMARKNQQAWTISTDVTCLWYRAPEVLLGANSNYSTVMWHVGCIFAEMTSGEALFKGDAEISQLFTIFSVLTTPTQENWPGVEVLPYYRSTFPKWTKYTLREKTKNMDDEAYDLLQKLLTYNTKTRISAEAAVQHVYFDNIRGQLPSSSKHIYY